jgi:predicted nucleic-acid-binding protein
MSVIVRTLDTNILVRLFVSDDERQEQIALALLEEPFLILPSVLIELIWVLSSRYKLKRAAFLPKLRILLGMRDANLGSQAAIIWALDRYEAGADFADMLHYALAEELGAESFATFDKRIKPHQVTGSTVTLEQLG